MKVKLVSVPGPQAQATKAPSILDKRFKYIPAAKTDIVQRFRAMGWVPPSEKRGDK